MASTVRNMLEAPIELILPGLKPTGEPVRLPCTEWCKRSSGSSDSAKRPSKALGCRVGNYLGANVKWGACTKTAPPRQTVSGQPSARTAAEAGSTVSFTWVLAELT